MFLLFFVCLFCFVFLLLFLTERKSFAYNIVSDRMLEEAENHQQEILAKKHRETDTRLFVTHFIDVCNFYMPQLMEELRILKLWTHLSSV